MSAYVVNHETISKIVKYLKRSRMATSNYYSESVWRPILKDEQLQAIEESAI